MKKDIKTLRAPDMTHSLKHFIANCPTPWHVQDYIATECASLSNCVSTPFSQMPELVPGKKYIIHKGGMLIGIIMPEGSDEQREQSSEKSLVQSLIINACHTDSPCLKVKQHGMYTQDGMTLLNCEVYGSPILASWIGRPLTVTGKIWGKDIKGNTQEWLLPSSCISAVIPNIAIHLDRNVNENGLLVQKQDMLSPIVSLHGDVASLEELFLPYIPELKKIQFHDLFVVPTVDHSVEMRNEGIFSPRLDNLSSAWALFHAFQETSPRNDGVARLYFFCNHEEIGSETSEGAYSASIEDVVNIVLSQASSLDRLKIKSRSIIISCDAAHAVHPLAGEKHDSRHKVFIGKGIALKLHSQQRYSSPPEQIARFISFLEHQKIPYQIFTSRNDIPCGSTVGPILAARLGIDAVDVGAPIVGMHAAMELGSVRDVTALKNILVGMK